MNRRRFFALLFAPFVAKWRKPLPAPEPKLNLDAFNEYTKQFIAPRMADVIFSRSPIFTALKARQLGATTISEAMIRHRLEYGCAVGTGYMKGWQGDAA